MNQINLQPPQPHLKRQRFECPHCDHTVPVDESTECDNCGAHLQLNVETVVPPIDDGGQR